LFEARHYPSVVALVSDALEDEPEHVELLMLRARANHALRNELDCQADLRDIIRLDPHCALAYRLLGELAARQDQMQSAATFFREALRLDPDDEEAQDWLTIVEISSRPAAVAQKLPAPAAAAGRFPRRPQPTVRRSNEPPRFASGTINPPWADEDEDDPTDHDETGEHFAVPRASSYARIQTAASLAVGSSPELQRYSGPSAHHASVMQPQPQPQPQDVSPEPSPHGTLPELPGFGEYLVATGVLTRERLRAAQAYQRSMRVQLATAIVTLGLATPQRIQWAVVAHQSSLARGGY
jgi:tetratricopeptide (TPR) repeat protein